MLILLVTPDAQEMGDFTSALESADGVELTLAGTGLAALEIAKSKKPQVVVVGENVPDFKTRELLMALLQVNAMINTAVITDMNEEAFHDFYEGFGVLLPLPLRPSADDAEALLAKARSVLGAS